MKNHRFPWLRNRTTDNRKCEKARNIKEKCTIEMFNTVSRKQEEQASSRRDKKLEQAFQRNPYSSRVFVVVKSGARVRIHGGLQHVCNKLSLKLGHFF